LGLTGYLLSLNLVSSVAPPIVDRSPISGERTPTNNPKVIEQTMDGTALITGITGQDGSYLAELLLAKGYAVHGLIRPSGSTLDRIQHLLDQVQLHPADILDQQLLIRLLEQVRPTEVYNLAAESFVPTAWKQPLLTAEATAFSVIRLLDSIRQVNPKIRFYQASSSEIFGKVYETPQRETTAFRPRNPYGTAKAYAHYITMNYREHYDLFACSGILFNHESPRRGQGFVSRKITQAVASIKAGYTNELRLGNLSARRDWGFAGDYVQAMWLMLQQDTPRDFVIGTGDTHTVEEFVKLAFSHASLQWQDHVVIDPQFYRAAESDILVADSTHARTQLGWSPKVSFEELVCQMVDEDLRRLGHTSSAPMRMAG
jgi:GDPmannose 4,6-dehydratase